MGIGISIVTRAGPSVRLASITRHEGTTPVYNFEVEGTHSSFVGHLGQGLWVHNACVPAFVRDARTVASWAATLQKAKSVIDTETADALVALARQHGVSIRALDVDLVGHPGTPWDTPHIHIVNQEFHVPVPCGYRLPAP